MYNYRNIGFIALSMAAVGMAYQPMTELLSNRMLSDYYSHIVLIPMVSAFLMASNRKEIFTQNEYWLKAGFVSILGIMGYLWGRTLTGTLSQNDYTSWVTLFVLVFWIGGFSFLFGKKALKAGFFPVLFLIFTVPIPDVIMERVIYLLQIGSAEFTSVLFGLIGVPISREGFVFHTPTVSIEIAKQCSGIRSSLGLLITGVLASHFFLKSNVDKAILIAVIYPITVFKNAVRIVTLTLLAIHVDPGFLTGGFLHKSGGFIFYIPGLLIMGIILMALRKREKTKS